MSKDIEYEIKSLDPSKIHLIEIIAGSVGEFSEIVEKLNQVVKEAGAKKNIVYTHRGIDHNTGKPMESNIGILTNDQASTIFEPPKEAN